MTGPAKTERHGLVRQVHGAMRFPPPVDDPLISSRRQAATYLGAWGLTATHLILWLLIAIGLLTSEALVIGVSLLSFAATCLFIGMVIAAHRRLQLYHGSTTRHLATVWWRGPWDPVRPADLAAGTTASRLAHAPPPDEPTPATRTWPLTCSATRESWITWCRPHMDHCRQVSPDRFGSPGLRPSGRHGVGRPGDGTQSVQMGTSPLAGPAGGPRSPPSHPARRGPPQLPSSQADQQSYTS